MEDELRKRIVKYMDERGLSVNSLAAKTPTLQTRTIQNQIRSKTAISATTILEILYQDAELSAEWLLRGAGDMFVQDISDESALIKKVREQSELIRRQQREIDGLYERIKELKKEGVSSAENILAAG